MEGKTDSLKLFLDRIYRINWIFFFGRSPEESGQTPIAFGELEKFFFYFVPNCQRGTGEKFLDWDFYFN